MIDNHPAPLIGGLGLLERALGFTLGCLRLVTADALAHPTPCAGWDLRALLAHLDDSLAALHEAAEPGVVAALPDAVTAADPVRRLRDRSCRLLGAWTAASTAASTAAGTAASTAASTAACGDVSVGGLPLTAGLVTGVGAMEVTVHGWDVARACGTDRPIPASLADELLDLATVIVDDADRPARFGPPVAVHPAAGPAARLVAFLGRDPRSLLR
jgi:uncharacterized protein (TIGR03086 family)